MLSKHITLYLISLCGLILENGGFFWMFSFKFILILQDSSWLISYHLSGIISYYFHVLMVRMASSQFEVQLLTVNPLKMPTVDVGETLGEIIPDTD